MNEKIYEKLILAFKSKKLPSSIIFWGSSSSKQKKDFIFKFSSEILSQNSKRSSEETLQRIISNTHSDFYYIDPFSNSKTTSLSGSIKTEQINILDDILKYDRPFESEYRIIFVNNAEKMTIQAQNAFLKKFEEPQANTIFFLSTTKKDALLQTITSRAVSIFLPGIIEKNNQKSILLAKIPFLKQLSEEIENFDDFFQQEISFLKDLESNALNITFKNFSNISKILLYNLDNKSFYDKYNVSENKKVFIKTLVLKFRLAFLADKIKFNKPKFVLELIDDFKNIQTFSPESRVFGNMFYLIK